RPNPPRRSREWRAWAPRGWGRGMRRAPAELPIQSDRTQAGGSRQLIVGDVVDLECAAVDVAQHEIGCACPVRWRYARELPFQPNRADEGGIGDLVVGDVVDFQPAGIIVAQQHVGFAGGGTTSAYPALT